MTFQLTIGILLAYIVPGLIVAWATLYLFSPAREFASGLFANPTPGSALLAGILIFAFGAIADSVRSLLLDWLFGKLLKRRPPEGYLQKLNEKNLPVFLMLIERTQEFYRLNANSCVALFSLLIAILVARGFHWSILLVAAWASLMLWASYKTRRETFWAMEQFCKAKGD